MTDISKSPERHTFQVEGAKRRAKEKGEEVPEQYLEFWKTAKEQDEENLVDPKWQKNNMEYDLRATDWILAKVRESDSYAQNLYAAICNNDFCKREMWPILKEEYWSASWRSAGGIIADMRENGDYIDWYCSGIGGGLGNGDEDGSRGYVSESVVTEEIKDDLYKLGWLVIESKGDLE
jgi:hypothetical protein